LGDENIDNKTNLNTINNNKNKTVATEEWKVAKLKSERELRIE
jgi:hypothetical protein